MNTNYNYLFDVKPSKEGQALRGFLDVNSKEIVIYDDNKGGELFRIGNNKNGVSNNVIQEPEYEKGKITLTVKNATSVKQTAILFAANREPLIQPLGITVTVNELKGTYFDSHNYLRRDILSHSIKILNLRYVVDDESQFDNILQFGYAKAFGDIKYKTLEPRTYIDLYQEQAKVMFMKDFKGTIDSKSEILVPINPNSSCTLQFDCLFVKQNGNKNQTNNNKDNSMNFNGHKNFVEKKEENVVTKIDYKKVLKGVFVLSVIGLNVYLLNRLYKNNIANNG